MTTDTERAGEATDLLQHLIRNACVNDGTPASGQEHRSADLLKGSTLDYSDGLQGAGFHVTNPNASRTCGCGSSFS